MVNSRQVCSHISMLYLRWEDCKPYQHTQLWNEFIPHHSDFIVAACTPGLQKVLELSKWYCINFNEINSINFKIECKRAMKIHFRSQWVADTQNLHKNSILRYYLLYVFRFNFWQSSQDCSNKASHQLACSWTRSVHSPQNSRMWPTLQNMPRWSQFSYWFQIV